MPIVEFLCLSVVCRVCDICVTYAREDLFLHRLPLNLDSQVVVHLGIAQREHCRCTGSVLASVPRPSSMSRTYCDGLMVRLGHPWISTFCGTSKFSNGSITRGCSGMVRGSFSLGFMRGCCFSLFTSLPLDLAVICAGTHPVFKLDISLYGDFSMLREVYEVS